jgi:hypothetical protein
MYLQKVISRKTILKKYFCVGILKVNDENSRIWLQDPDPDPNPLVSGMDPRIRNTENNTTTKNVHLQMFTFTLSVMYRNI